MTPITQIAKGAIAAMAVAAFGFAGSAKAAQPVLATPVAPPVLNNVIYVIPYTVSKIEGPFAQTIVTINAQGAAAACAFQVEWKNFDGTTIGFSGGPFVAPAGGSYEYTTVPNGGVVTLFPFQQNVFRNTQGDFEGYANIRTNCAGSTKTGVDAEFVVSLSSTSASQDLQYRQIEPIRKAGNAGE